MKDLFDDMYMDFFGPELQMVTENKQIYFDYLAEMVILGQGFLPDGIPGSEELIERKLTPQEEEELYFRIGKFLNSLN